MNISNLVPALSKVLSVLRDDISILKRIPYVGDVREYNKQGNFSCYVNNRSVLSTASTHSMYAMNVLYIDPNSNEIIEFNYRTKADTVVVYMGDVLDMGSSGKTFSMQDDNEYVKVFKDIANTKLSKNRKIQTMRWRLKDLKIEDVLNII